MIRRHHVTLTLLCTLILCSALVSLGLILLLVICAGAVIGAILPDIQMKKPHGFRIRTIAWMISRFTSIVVTPLLCRLYHFLWGRPCGFTDKRLTHSIPGILFLWAVMAVLVLVPSFILIRSAALCLPAAFLCGMMLGMVLHLAGDMCTRKGITHLFPFSSSRVSGSIRPCDITDQRIGQFHFYHLSVAGIILGFRYLDGWQGIASVPLCLFALCSCLGMMIWLSDVGICREIPVNETRTPALFDPFIARWKAEHPDPEFRMGFYFNKNEQ